MTETLLTEKSYNHFAEAPGRFFPDGIEKRSEENPDLVLLLVGFGDDIDETRLLYDKHIASRPDMDIQRQFYDPISKDDIHSTLHRIGLKADVKEDQIADLITQLRTAFADFSSVKLRYGEKWLVGDAIISELTAENDDDPVRLMRAIASEALVATGFPECSGDFTSHSSDRYARALNEGQKESIKVFMNEADIDPAVFTVPGIVVGVNWPEHDDASNYGTYKYKIIAFIPFADTDEATGLSIVRNKLIVPSVIQ